MGSVSEGALEALKESGQLQCKSDRSFISEAKSQTLYALRSTPYFPPSRLYHDEAGPRAVIQDATLCAFDVATRFCICADSFASSGLLGSRCPAR